jgi:spore germination protein
MMNTMPTSTMSLALALALACSIPLSAQAGPAVPLLIASEIPGLTELALESLDRPPLAFKEVWAYLMAGEERFLPSDAPISDLAYFSARISSKGELYGTPNPERIAGIKARKHLVLAEVSNQALIHFVLNPAYPLRDRLIKDLAAAAKPYDGVNIDFELIRSDDGPAFLEFLRLLKKALGSKTLSVCVPARTRKMDDAYDYAKLAAIADRVFVMSYDEHWSGSAAGPVSSIGWASRVASWAAASVGPAKLIMGMPFYGRAWGDKSPAGAYKYSSASQKIAEQSATPGRNAEGIPYFRFSESVNLIMYFDDAYSTRLRGEAYQKAGVVHIGFWRLGQEDPAIWRVLRLN